MAIRLFISIYDGFTEKGYFQEGLGYTCVDGGEFGTIGQDQEAYFFRKLRKNIWPPHKHHEEYTEDDLFDLVEGLFDLVSKPLDGRYHAYGQCGWHYTSFDQDAGRVEFRGEVNSFLRDYGPGYELNESGEIYLLPDSGLEPLLETPLSSAEPDAIDARVNKAIQKFQRRGATPDDRLDAIRDLAAVLEYLRPEAKKVLESKDEADLFNIANNFAIRHYNKQQSTQYDREIWFPWIFYVYLASIHAIVRLLERGK